MKNLWPKKVSASMYRDTWYVDLSVKTIHNWIKTGDLPGIKDNGKWFVWVNEDMTPANDAFQDAAETKVATLSPKAQSIIDQIREAHGS